MANFSSVNGQSATLLATKGLVRPNRFFVNITFPNTQGISKFQEYVESVEFPAMAIGTADYQYNTQPIPPIPSFSRNQVRGFIPKFNKLPP